MEITKLNDSSAAVESFKKKLKSQEMYYNKVPFPQNESTNEAYLKCDSVEGAKKHCPSRWKAITEWFERSQQVGRGHLLPCACGVWGQYVRTGRKGQRRATFAPWGCVPGFDMS